MKKIFWSLFVFAIGTLAVSPAAFAQTSAAAAGGGPNYGALAAGFGMALAAFGGALGRPKWRQPRAKAWRGTRELAERFARR
jgi:hypothetical protein